MSVSYRHPLARYTYNDDVPITLHPSPAMIFHDEADRREAIRIESKLYVHLFHLNTPCMVEGATIALGECNEHLFDMYMSATMPRQFCKRYEEDNEEISNRQVENAPFIFRSSIILTFF